MPDARLGGGARRGAVLFDLDGTFADTAPDMAYALDLLLARHGRPPLPFAAERPHVTQGARALVRLGFGLDAGDPRFDERRREPLEVLDWLGVDVP